MQIYIPDADYFKIHDEVRKAFTNRTLPSSAELQIKIAECAKETHMESKEIENFVSVSASHIYFMALADAENIVADILGAIAGAGYSAGGTEFVREFLASIKSISDSAAAKESTDPLENAGA